MNDPYEIRAASRPAEQGPGSSAPATRTAPSAVTVMLWVLLAVALSLNGALSVAGYPFIAAIPGLATVGLGITLLMRHLRRRAS